MTETTPGRAVPRRDWDIIFVAALTLPVALVALAVGRVDVYATADAGISLANADSLVGRGIRPTGHLPVFALLTNVTRLFSSDLATFRVLAVFVSFALALAFYVFVRNRTNAPVAEVGGALLFAAAPTTAEAVGWYGLTMLLGIALAVLAFRTIDDWLRTPSLRRAAVAGTLAILTSLTHAVPFLWFLQTAGLFVVGHVVALWLRGGRDTHADRLRRLARSAPILAAFVAVSLAVILANSSRLESAVGLSLDLDNLRLVSSFGFRNSALWLLGLGFGLIGAPLLAARDGKNLRLAGWGACAGWVALADLVLLRGNQTYENRQVYLLAVCVCAGFTVFAARGVQFVRARNPLPGAAIIAAAVVVLAVSGPAFADRLHQATDFYNRVSTDEIAGLRWIDERNGALFVAPSDDDFYDGTTISWLAQGMARQRAISATEGYRNLIESDRRDSDDAALVLAGDTTRVEGNLAIGRRTWNSEMLVLGRYDHSWLPLATLESDDPRVAADITGTDRITVRVPATARLTVRDRSRDARVRVGKTSREGGDEVTTITFQGLQAAPSARQGTYRASALLSTHRVRWIWTPRSSESEREFQARGYAIAYDNSAVVIFDARALRRS